MNRSLIKLQASRIAVLLALALMFLAVIVQGCAEENQNKAAYSKQASDEEVWAEGADAPPTPQTLHSMARIFASQGRDSEAAYVLERIIKEHPQFLPAYVELAEVHMRGRRVDTAIEVLNKGLEVAPKDAVLLNNMGMCYAIKADYDRAVSLFSEAAAAMPENIRYRANIAMALGMAGKYEAALRVYQQVLPPAEAHYNLAVLCEARGDKDQAAVHFDEAERLRALANENEGRIPDVELEVPPQPPAQ